MSEGPGSPSCRGTDLNAEAPDIVRAAVNYASQLRQTHARELRAIDEIAHNLRRPDGAPRLDLRAYDDTYQAQAKLFQRGQQEGSLRAFDTRVMAVTYQGAVDTMIAYLEAHPEADARVYANALTDLLLNAIRRSPARAQYRQAAARPNDTRHVERTDEAAQNTGDIKTGPASATSPPGETQPPTTAPAGRELGANARVGHIRTAQMARP